MGIFWIGFDKRYDGKEITRKKSTMWVWEIDRKTSLFYDQ